VSRAGAQIIVFCDEGYQSSLAASTLRRLGIDATDMIGGVQAWRAAGLPLEPSHRTSADSDLRIWQTRH
jgi:rhodanese-related sulfurtransferase